MADDTAVQDLHPLRRLQRQVGERSIWIWGAGNQGRGIARALSKHAVEVAGFIDRAAQNIGGHLMGLPVVAADRIAAPDFSRHHFVIVAAYFFEREIAEELSGAGLREGIDFLPYSQLKPVDFSIDISGTCNLKCISCPRSSPGSGERKPGFMSLDSFRRILDKIVAEQPFVGNVQLYQWGEPTLHPQLPEIVEYARSRDVLCAISSNLNAKVDYRRILAARPEWLRISASGWGDDYEVTHTRGRWEDFLTHLREVARLRRELYPEMKVELYYHLYRHSVGDGLQRFEALARELGLELRPINAYLVSLDDVLGYCEGKPLPEPARRASELLLMSLEQGVELARRYAAEPCDALRCININWDGSVSNCMLYYYPKDNVAADDFLSIPTQEIQRRRYASDLCRRCMGHGIHQYCSAYARLDSGADQVSFGGTQ